MSQPANWLSGLLGSPVERVLCFLDSCERYERSQSVERRRHRRRIGGGDVLDAVVVAVVAVVGLFAYGRVYIRLRRICVTV